MGDITKATYLLRASQDDMGRWKADAERQHVSFNAHIAACLDSVASIEQRARWAAAAERQQMSLHEWIIDTLDVASDPESGADILLQDRESTDVGAAPGRTASPAKKQPEPSTMRPLTDDQKTRPKARSKSARCPHGREPDAYCSRCDAITRA